MDSCGSRGGAPDKAVPFRAGVSYVAPHLNNLYFLPLCRRWGVYAVVRGLFLLKLGLSLLMLLAGPDRPSLLCLFIARYALPPSAPHVPLSHPFILAPSLFAGSNRVFTEGTCKLLTLVVSDLVDEDLVLNHRKQAASALLFGMVALVTKPGQTFAPLLGTWLLCFYTGEGLGAGAGLLRLQGSNLPGTAADKLGPVRGREWQLAERGCAWAPPALPLPTWGGELSRQFFQSFNSPFIHSSFDKCA